LNRPLVRALLVSAAVAAAIALAGCNPEDVVPTGRSQAPLSEKTLAQIEAKQMDKDSPILARIFKEEAEMEIWKKTRDGEYALLKTYPICRWSGDLGPKKKEGDRQAPEGFYTITPGQMNPASNYFLAFNTGFPNAYDRAWGYTGSELMVHGDCSSRGCYAMTDEQIQEIYALARDSFFGGQKAFQLEAFPFRMTALNMAKHRNNPNLAFWKMLKDGYDSFEATRQEPKVAVCDKHYVFDAAAPENSTRPLNFSPRGTCPVYRLDPTVADAVLDHRRQEQVQMANYIAHDIAVVPFRVGDGGMNPVFEAKLTSPNIFDNNGRIYQVAGNSQISSGAQVPGALPRTPNRLAVTAAPPAKRPVVLASVPTPEPAPQAKEDEAPPEQPKSITGLLGKMFGGSNTEAQPTEPVESQAVALRGSKTEMAAKLKRTAPVRTATAPTKPPESASAKPRTVATENSAPASAPAVQQARDSKPPTPDMRTAYSSPPPADKNGLLQGAQPVVSAGSFESRWTALR
jgi:murein L,D-transpeptidase YafK